MDKKEIQLKKQEVVTDVICDICYQSCKVAEHTVDNPARTDNGEKTYQFSYMELKATWGYHSSKDLENWKAKVCESCVDKYLTKIVRFQKTGVTGQPLKARS